MTPPEMVEDDSTATETMPWWMSVLIFITVVGVTVGIAILLIRADTYDEQRADVQRQLEELQDQPIPTMIVTTPGPVRTKIVTTPGPTKTVYIERSSDKASRSKARSTVNLAKTDSSIPTTGRFRFTVNGLDLRHRDFWMCVHAREGSWTDRSGFEGGLQFMNSTWLWAGGGYISKHAYQATPNQQITVANWLSNGAKTGIYHNWPNTGPPCARKFGMAIR